MNAESKLVDLEQRITKLEAEANPETLKWSGTTRCANLIVALASDISFEELSEIKGPGQRPELVTIRAAAAYVMMRHGKISQRIVGKLFGRHHTTIWNMQENHFDRPEVQALAAEILASYRKGGAR